MITPWAPSHFRLSETSPPESGTRLQASECRELPESAECQPSIWWLAGGDCARGLAAIWEDARFVVLLVGPLAEGGCMFTSRAVGVVVAGTADIRDSPSTEAADRGLLAQVAAIDRHFARVLSVDIAAARAGPGKRARPHRARGGPALSPSACWCSADLIDQTHGSH